MEIRDGKVKKRESVLIQSVHAILLVEGRYVLQLRDNSPMIAASGQWSLFGGRIQDGEEPEVAIQREIEEELCLRPSFKFLWSHHHFGEFEQQVIRVFFFSACLDAIWHAHRLQEGRDVKAFRYQEIKTLNVPAVIMSSIDRFHGYFT